MKKRLLAILVSVSMMLGLMPAIAYADEGDVEKYLALGDSISSGYGLDDKDTQSFVSIFAQQNGFEANDSYARAGMTSSELLGMIADAEVAAAIAEADVITITIGGNDVLETFYAYLASAYNTVNPGAGMTAADIQTVLAGDDVAAKAEMIAFAASQAQGFSNSEEVATALDNFTNNLSWIVAGIRDLNPSVDLLIANQYNPYGFLAKEFVGTDYEDVIGAISNVFDSGARSISTIIATGSMTGAYINVDAYNAFEEATENPCNASATVVSAMPLLVDLNLDFHPNAYGHALLANAFVYALHPSAEFPDVDPSEWYIDAIDWAVAVGAFGGYSDTGFMGPEKALTRAEMAQALWNVAQNPVVDKSVLAGFDDVDMDEWYADALAWAVSNGLLCGYEDTTLMGPGDALTTEQTAVVFMRIATLFGADVSGRADLSGFLDAEYVSDWAYDAMSWAVDAGVINGFETEVDARGLAPQTPCTRAQMAAIMMNFFTIAM